MMKKFLLTAMLTLVMVSAAAAQTSMPAPWVQGGDCALTPIIESRYSLGAGEFFFAMYGCGGKTPSHPETWDGGRFGTYNSGVVTLLDEGGFVNIIGAAHATAPVFADGMLSYNPSVSALTLANATIKPGYWWSFGTIAQHGARLDFTAPTLPPNQPAPFDRVFVLDSIASAQALGLEDNAFGNWAFAGAGNTSVTVIPGSSFYSRMIIDANLSPQVEFGTGLTGHSVVGAEFVTPNGAGEPAKDSLGNDLDVLAQISAAIYPRNGGHNFTSTAMANAVIHSFSRP